MNRLHQNDPAQATGKTKQLFDSLHAKLGFVPNLMRVLGNSSAALQGYLDLSAALANGALPGKLREQIALAVAEINGCDYCLSAHSLLAGRAGLQPDDIDAARRSEATEAKSDAALKLARSITLQRGQLSDADLQTARKAGWRDEEIVEIIQNVALNILTNYTNSAAHTEIDFPEVKPLSA